jgi:splicing factor 3B subunit 1
MSNTKKNLIGSYTLPKELESSITLEQANDAIESNQLKQNIVRNDYKQKRYNRTIDTNLDNVMSYKQLMEQRQFEQEEFRVKKLVQEKQEQAKEELKSQTLTISGRKRRWDVTPEEYQRNAELAQLESKKLKPDLQTESTALTTILNDDLKVPVIGSIALTDEILDKILPPGYSKLIPPENYHPDDTIPPDVTSSEMDYYMPPLNVNDDQKTKIMMDSQLPTDIPGVQGLQHFKQEDMKYFGKLLTVNESKLTPEEAREINAMRLILKVKNGSPLVRKRSLRQVTDNATKFGAKTLFNQLLPILLEPNLEDQEKHLLIKLVGRLLTKLNDLVRPFTHKIVLVIAPLLIEEDFTLRMEARDIISGLTKATGLATMISSLRPDLDHVDEYIRNITSRVFAIVANTLGLVSFLPFLKAVVKSKKNWTARHTGIKIVQQLSIILGGGNGNAILPYLGQLVEVLKPALTDEVLQVRSITALTLSQLADNVKPYGIESFESILEPAWLGLRKHRGKGLANFLKCIGSLIPLMVHNPNYEEYANYYTKELMTIITREFTSPDDEMRKTVLRILGGLPLSRQIVPKFNTEIMRPFMKHFWNRRTASDSQLIVKLVADTTRDLSNKFDFLEILEHVIIFAKNDNEQLRKLCMETVHKMISSNPDNLIGLDSQLEVRLIDGVLYAFQEQTIEHKVYLLAFGSVAKTLNTRLKPHINSIISTVLYRLQHKSPEVRQQAAALISVIAPVISLCAEGDNEIMRKLILILYESLGEVYPDVLASLLDALYSCIGSLHKTDLYVMKNPSINQILPTLTPILKNRQEKVQEASIKLVGLIAKKNSETINAKEWMRICFELLDMLKSNKKKIRIAANDTFGYIAKTIGPLDVIVMLLNNLRVQERQLRVCTAVAIGIVAETCAPFTVIPAIMNEYRIPEKNVQNGVLKALSFLFEYIDGSMTKDYLFAITPLLENALTDRDQVHRQTAATVIKHMALNCIGLTNDDFYEVFIHFLNLLMPNIFETSPHVINRILESVNALRVVIGVGTFSNYIWAGLFHPARRVRTPYWKIYNNIYVQNCDALVPYYPTVDKFPDEENVSYKIEEMDLFL